MQRPSRRTVLTTLAAAGAGALAGCLGDDSDPDPVTLADDFAGGLDDWEIDAALGEDDDASDFDYDIALSDEEVYAGDQSVEIYTEGDHDDGTAWIVQPVDVEAGHRYHAEASVMAWSHMESFNMVRRLSCVLAPERPQTQTDFPPPDWNSTGEDEPEVGGFREPLDLAEGWYEYTFEWDSPELDTDTLYFAVGTRVVWTGDRTHWIDDVDLTIEPR